MTPLRALSAAHTRVGLDLLKRSRPRQSCQLVVATFALSSEALQSVAYDLPVGGELLKALNRQRRLVQFEFVSIRKELLTQIR